MNNTITYLAKQIGTSQGHLSNIKDGKRRPGPDLALKISQITETPLEIWLFKTPEYLAARKSAIKQALTNQTPPEAA